MGASRGPGPPATLPTVNLLKAVFTVSGMTLASRVTGLVRESLKAAVFGAGAQSSPRSAPVGPVQSDPAPAR